MCAENIARFKLSPGLFEVTHLVILRSNSEASIQLCLVGHGPTLRLGYPVVADGIDPFILLWLVGH
ncbi:MAG: hypothetical protein ABW100_06060, partial [Candidatus Thiodiazotropha sp. 6PLUC3]